MRPILIATTFAVSLTIGVSALGISAASGQQSESPRPVHARRGSPPHAAHIAAEQVAAAKAQMESKFRDPDGARYRNTHAVRSKETGAILFCGEVNMRNGFGGMTGYRRFIVDDDGALIDVGDIEGAVVDNAWSQICPGGSLNPADLGLVNF